MDLTCVWPTSVWLIDFCGQTIIKIQLVLDEIFIQNFLTFQDQGDCIQALEKQSVPHITESPVHINFTSPENFHTLTEENLGKTVVDLVLQETKNEIKELEETINMLKTEINDKNLKISTQEEIIESQVRL